MSIGFCGVKCRKQAIYLFFCAEKVGRPAIGRGSLSVSPGRKFFTKKALRRFAFSRLEVAMMSPFLSVGMMLCLLLRDFMHHFPKFFLIVGMQVPKKFTFCMSQVGHNLVSEFLEHETIISSSTTMSFLKIQISLSDQLNDLLV